VNVKESQVVQSRPTVRIVFAALEITLIVATGLLAAVGFIRILPALLQIPDQPDFAAYYLAAQLLNAGESPYDAEQMSNAAEHSGGIDYTAYVYPPFLAALFRPFATLRYDTAKALWLGLNLAFLIASMGLLTRLVGLPAVRLAVPISLAALLMPAVYDTLLFGQTNLLLLLLVACALHLSPPSPTRWREVIAGLVLGVAVAIKLYPAILALAYLVHRRFLSLASLALGVFTAFFLGIVGGGGWHNTARYFSQVLPAISRGTLSPYNQSIHAVLARLFSVNQFRFSVLSTDNYITVTFNPVIDAPRLGTVLAQACTLLIVVLSVYALARRLRSGSINFSLPFDAALLTATALLITPIVWHHYYVLVLIPLSGLACHYRRSRRRSLRIAFLLALQFLVLQRYWRWLSQFLASPILLAFGFIGVLILWSTLLQIELSPLGMGSGDEDRH